MIFGKLNLCFVCCGHKENGLPLKAAVSGSVSLLEQYERRGVLYLLLPLTQFLAFLLLWCLVVGILD